MSYHHLSRFERGRIEELLTLAYSHRAIAKWLGGHHSCIDRELNRNKSDAGYC
jgi:IS30 family transposase